MLRWLIVSTAEVQGNGLEYSSLAPRHNLRARVLLTRLDYASPGPPPRARVRAKCSCTSAAAEPWPRVVGRWFCSTRPAIPPQSPGSLACGVVFVLCVCGFSSLTGLGGRRGGITESRSQPSQRDDVTRVMKRVSRSTVTVHSGPRRLVHEPLT